MKIFAKICALLFISVSTFAQQADKKVTLYWDSSYGMEARNLQLELEHLDTYFKENPELTLKLIKFSNTVILNAAYKIVDGNWTLLKSELEKTIYDGATYYKNIKELNVDEILIFTDGNEGLDILPQGFLKPVQLVSSVKNVNERGLQLLATSSRGSYTNLYKSNALNEAVATVIVKGIVSDISGPLNGVGVVSRDTKASVATNEHGAYTIEARPGTILEYSFIGKNTLISRVPKSGLKDVVLADGNEVLEEVIVKADGKEELINTGYGKEDKKRLGYGIETIGAKDISEQDLSLENVVNGQFSNVSLKGDQDITQFLSRGNNMSILLDQTGLVVVDGVPMESSPQSLTGKNAGDRSIIGQSSFLNPDNIASITMLKGLAATNKWGTLGRNGVILVTTKNGVAGKDRRKKPIELGTTPTYTGDAESAKSLADKPYIKALQQSKSIDAAYAVYLEQRKKYGNSMDFFFNVASYFKDWNNEFMLKRILSNVVEVVTEETPDVLLAQAYKYEEFGMYESVIPIYERLIKMAPSNTQSYRNLALAYRKTKNFKESLSLYNKMHKNRVTNASSFNGLRKTIVNEYKNLVAMDKGKLNASLIDPFFNNNITYDTRIVFEWNVFDAEFDLQIVNPQNRYFTWSHTQKKEAVRFANEMADGFGVEEFFITKDDKGAWIFNVSYLGKRNSDNTSPTYLKVTTYKNFGKPNQSEKIRTFTLDELNKKQTILNIKI